jgi:DNA-binding SARP family transcriptional activator
MSGHLMAALESHDGGAWKALTWGMGSKYSQAAEVHVQPSQRSIGIPEEVGPDWFRGTQQVLEKLLVPRDPRGIVLLCGFIAAAALGASALMVGDPIGYGYLGAVAVGYFFLQTRLVPTVLWLLVALGGAAGAVAGNTSDWIVCALGTLLAIVSLIPVPIQYRFGSVQEQESSRKVELSRVLPRSNGASGVVASGESSRKVEDSPAPRSANADGGVPSNGDHWANGAGELASRSATRPARVAIRTMGRLRLEIGERDLTQRLNEQPRLEFLLSYLLARNLRGGEVAVDRAALADEVAPGFPAGSQRDRLRKQLHALQSTLGPQLRGLVSVNKTHITLDLVNVEVDVAAVITMSRLVARRHSLIDAGLAEQINDLLETTAGREFLSGFSELEHQVTQGRGTASEVVEQARVLIAECRADLTRALAEYHEAIGRPRASIAYLQTALTQTPGRQDLARLLVAAYLQTGQTGPADQARREYDLTQEK